LLKWPSDFVGYGLDRPDSVALNRPLGVWVERDINELILEAPEEVLAELEDECRERCVSLEFLMVDRMNACRDAGGDPVDW
jgi:hypothetical protein